MIPNNCHYKYTQGYLTELYRIRKLIQINFTFEIKAINLNNLMQVFHNAILVQMIFIHRLCDCFCYFWNAVSLRCPLTGIFIELV